MHSLPAVVKLIPEFQHTYDQMGANDPMAKEIDDAFLVLRENAFAGHQVPKDKIAYWTAKYKVRNLYKYNLRNGNRLIYAIEKENGVPTVLVIVVFDHDTYLRKFGYE